MMIPFTNPEIQLELLRQQTSELIRDAAEYRLARSLAPRRRGRWPRLRRSPRQSLA